MPNPVIHWEITGKDAPKLQQFYANLLGWNVDSNNPMNYGLVDTQTEDGINGGIAQEQESATRVTVYVQVDDLQAYLDKAESLGGKTILPPTVIPDTVTLAMFTDPEGNITGMVTG
jgi:predicted enzyme related to lactoylglutathione lyase